MKVDWSSGDVELAGADGLKIQVAKERAKEAWDGNRVEEGAEAIINTCLV